MCITASDRAFHKGDLLEIDINTKKALLASVLAFLVPAAVFTVILTILKEKEVLFSFLLAIGAVCIYYGVLKILLIRYGRAFEARIIRKIVPGPSVNS